MMTQNKSEILLIDDSPMMTRFLSLFLEQQYTVTSVHCPLEALKMIRGGYRPQAVITDLDMPEISGPAFVETLRTELPDCPLVVVSGLKESKYRLGALEAGADDYLSKPFHPAELQVRLKKLIGQARKQTVSAPVVMPFLSNRIQALLS